MLDASYMQKAAKLSFQALPKKFDLVLFLWKLAFNSSVWTTYKTKKELEKPTSLYDLDLFSLNTTVDYNLSPAEYSSNTITSRYFSPHSLKEMKTKLSKDETISRFSVFHNNVVSKNRNLENLQTQILHEVDFYFNVIGITETKITNANSQLLVLVVYPTTNDSEN